MKRTLVLIALVAGCSIPGDRFFKPGDHTDGGNGDGSGSGSADAKVDSPQGAGMRHGWIIDFQNGIYQVNKDPTTGALTLGSTMPAAPGTPQSAVTNKQGTHLFAIEGGVVQDYQIVNGTQLTLAGSFPVNGCTAMRFGALHPTGNWVAIGCTNNRFAIASVNAQGAVTSVNSFATNGVTILTPAWTPNGNCLYFSDLNGAANARIQIWNFDQATGAALQFGTVSGPPVPRGIAVHPMGQYLYLQGTGSPSVIQAYSIQGNCGLAPFGTGAPSSPNGNLITFDPTGTFLFGTGSEVYSYKIDASGQPTNVAGSPFIVGSPTMDGAIMDPAVPNILYITGRGIGGTYPAAIAMDGSVTMGTVATTNSGASYWFALSP